MIVLVPKPSINCVQKLDYALVRTNALNSVSNLRWLGHLARLEDQRIPKIMCRGADRTVKGHPRPGTFHYLLGKDGQYDKALKCLTPAAKDKFFKKQFPDQRGLRWFDLAQHRPSWRAFVNSVRPVG